MSRAGGAQSTSVGYPLATYRYVRLALVAVVAGLLASIALTAVPQNCWQTSLSAFYFTLSHAVFVGALCATGVCLIVYKGLTRPEDTLLNFAGFLAFVVALVPTHSPVHNPKDPSSSCGLWLPTNDDATAAVGNNITAVLIGAAVGIAAYLVVRATAGPPPRSDLDAPAGPDDAERPRGPSAKVANFLLEWIQVIAPPVTAATPAAGLLWFLFDRESFLADAHSAAAIAMFSGIIAVVVLYACYSVQHFCHCRGRGRFAVAYITIAVAMTVTLIVVGVLHVHLRTWNHGILALEIALIVEFAVFWLLQTLDSWNGTYRPVVPAPRLRAPVARTD